MSKTSFTQSIGEGAAFAWLEAFGVEHVVTESAP